MLQIAMRPAVELSYLRKEEQADLFAIMDEMDCTPSHAQAIKMRQMSEAKTGGERLAKDALVSIMKEEKPNQVEQFKIPKNRIAKFFPAGTPAQKIEDTIVKALELYRKRQRSLERYLTAKGAVRPFAGNRRFRCSPSPHPYPSYHLNSLKKKIFGEAGSFKNPQGYG